VNITTQAVSNAKAYDWQTWRLGLMRSFISGVSIAMAAGLSLILATPTAYNLSDHFFATLKVTTIIGAVQGVYRMCEFLSLHAIPDPININAPSAKAVNISQPDGGSVQVTQDKGK
jgi:hypothetical protein